MRLTARVFLYAKKVRYLKLHARAYCLYSQLSVKKDTEPQIASASIKLVDVASKQSIEADWAGDLDEGKSTTGYWFTHGGGAKLARGV